MRPFSARIQMLYVESSELRCRGRDSLMLSSCCTEKNLLPTLPLKHIWIRMCVTVHALITWNLLFREDYRHPYLVHIVAVEAVAGVAVGTGPTLHTLGRLYAQVLTETGPRHALWLHHLGAAQTFGSQTNV